MERNSYRAVEWHAACYKLQGLPVSWRSSLFQGLHCTCILTGVRLAKRRCLVDHEPGRNGCTRCMRHNIPCSLQPQAVARSPLDDGAGRSSSSPPANLSCSAAGATLLDVPWKAAAIQAYFDVVHGTHHSMLHQTSFDAQVAAGECPPVILYAVLAIGVR